MSEDRKPQKSYSIDEISQRLGKTRRTLYADIKAGKLKTDQDGEKKEHRVTISHLVEYIGADRVNQIFCNSVAYRLSEASQPSFELWEALLAASELAVAANPDGEAWVDDDDSVLEWICRVDKFLADQRNSEEPEALTCDHLFDNAPPKLKNLVRIAKQ